MIFAGGSGYLSNPEESDYVQGIMTNPKEGDYVQEIMTKSSKYKFNIAIGYKFRIQPQNKSYFLDMDLYAGLKRFEYGFSHYGEEIREDGFIIFHNEGSHTSGTYYYFAINPTYNYKVYKNLYFGAGIEPTLYFTGIDKDKWRFDIPPTLQIGYDFKYLGIAVGYKVGILDIIKSKNKDSRSYLKAGDLNDLQIQLFIPF
jgi:hypothetical protein